jgi:predicted AlkP superfamily phosphohydrolase/phosphomutase
MNSKKLLVIGLDGADREALIKGMNQDKLPNFKTIADQGFISTLKAPVPPTTPVSMSSILTGKNPDKHGVFSFEKDNSYVSYSSIESDTLFDYMDKTGKKVIPVNVPMTSPLPDELNIGISGFPVVDTEFAKPYPVREKVREKDYQVEPSRFGEDKDRFIEEVFDTAQKRFEISNELIEQEWDLFFLMFTGDARLQHFIDNDKVMEFYEKVDSYLGKLLEKMDKKPEILVISDHGFSKLETVFDLGNWLEKEDYLDNLSASDTSKLYGELNFNPEDSEAYPGGAYLGNIYADEKVQEEIVDKLSDLEYNGEKVFRDVLLSEDLYGVNNGPDIIPVPRRGMNYVAGYSDELFDSNPQEVKVPDSEGVIITSLKASRNQKVNSVDILPTLLDYLEIDYSELDGKSILDR